MTGQHSLFNATTRGLHQAILKTCEDKAKVEFIEVGGVANVLEEKVLCFLLLSYHIILVNYHIILVVRILTSFIREVDMA